MLPRGSNDGVPTSSSAAISPSTRHWRVFRNAFHEAGKQRLKSFDGASGVAAGVPCAWVTGDSVYGADYALLHCIEQYRRGYVMAATSAQRLGSAC